MLKNKKIIAQFGLLVTALIWGATFLIVKDALIEPYNCPPFIFSAMRFALASACIVFFLDFKLMRKNFLGPTLCGIVLFIGYGFQNYGLEVTTPVPSAFITSFSVLLVPVILYIFRIEQISLRIWVSVFLAFIGIQMISPHGFNIGDQLTFGCALSFAIHIIMQDKFDKSKIINFFFIQSTVAALLSFLAFLAIENLDNVLFFIDIKENGIDIIDIISSKVVLAVVITGILGTTFALLVMIWAQKILSASETAIIIAMEPVFAVMFSVYFGYDDLGTLSYVGCFLVVAAIIFCEVSRDNKSIS